MIGVFDSGLGGLTVLKSFLRVLPSYNYIYFGDSARAPYGGRSQDTIYGYTKEAVDFLFAKRCKLIIIACNSASAQALRKIQQEYLPQKYPGKNVLGVISPLVEEVAQDKNIKRVGVIGTRATIESDAYKIELKKLNPDLEIFQTSAPLLVPLIEEGWSRQPETKKILKKYLRPLKVKQVQILIPACTHYPILYKEIKNIMTKRCNVLNSGEVVAQSLKDYLERHPEYKINKVKNPVVNFFTTDDTKRFRVMAKKFLDVDVEKIKKVCL
ncbi:glutamate racemase [Candidatus Parcubacteria bacterium]|nr:glutamate racemase [Candidatus Parcubacteria bacterium]